jgi:two-component system, chemotaxis family, protein-glutamate methylesterase/glutaminase
VSAAAPRVVVADDSAFMRRLVSSALERAGIDVVAHACDGDEALACWERLRPDAMTLDLAMPGRDGIGVLRALRAGGERSVPVVVVSGFSPGHGARAVDALAEGAFDLVAKPASGEPLTDFFEQVEAKVRLAVGARAVAARPARPAAPVGAPRVATRKLVLIASSTGGPRALASLVPQLPATVGSGVLLVQHMPAGFTASLAARLDESAKLAISEAQGGEPVGPGTALLAPGGSHLRIGLDRRAVLSDADAIGGLRPRADLTIEDAAAIYRDRLLLVVLTGMGNDGLAGARAVKAAGGRVLAQDEATSTVYGMPRAVAEAGLADRVLGLEQLPAAIVEEAGG